MLSSTVEADIGWTAYPLSHPRGHIPYQPTKQSKPKNERERKKIKWRKIITKSKICLQSAYIIHFKQYTKLKIVSFRFLVAPGMGVIPWGDATPPRKLYFLNIPL